MVYDKPFLALPEQVKLLQTRGLEIGNTSEAELFLKQINYYRFSAFALPFQPVNDSFKPGTKLTHIKSLYDFDTRLRGLVLTSLEKIEIQVKSLVAHYLAENFDKFGYTDPRNFSDKFNHAQWLAKIGEEVVRSRETFVTHYRNKYSSSPHLPIWMLTEVMSFGSLSFLVKGLRKRDQKNIAKLMGIKGGVINNWLHHFTYIRNLCAHHCRLWNRKFAIKPVIPDNIGWQIPTDKTDRVICTLKIIQYLSDQFALEIDIIKTTKTLIKSHHTIPLKLEKIMGFHD